MGRRKKGEPPAYRLHKGRNLAYVTIDGKPVYLGEYGSAASKAKYRQLVKQFEQDHPPEPHTVKTGCRVEALVAAWSTTVLPRFGADEQRSCRPTLRPLLNAWGEFYVDDFGPRDLKRLRQVWIDAKERRQTVNKKVGRIRRLFRWGVGEGVVDPSTLAGLEAVADLVEGETNLEEYDEVLPVPLRDLVRTMRAGPPTLAAMLRVGYRVGCRAGELCRMKVGEIDRQGIALFGNRRVRVPGWIFQPNRHKNKKKSRRTKYLAYVVGKRSQRVLAPMLEGREPEDFVWSPAIVYSELHTIRGGRRPSVRRVHFATDDLAHVIAEICERENIPTWSPGRLRHNFLSRADAAFGIQAASAAVGHAHIATTESYLERNLRQAAEVAARLG